MQQGVLTELLHIYTKLHKCMAQRRRSPQLRTCIFRRNSPPMRTPVLTSWTWSCEKSRLRHRGGTFIMEEMRRPNALVSSHLQEHTPQVILMSHMTAHMGVTKQLLIDWLAASTLRTTYSPFLQLWFNIGDFQNQIQSRRIKKQVQLAANQLFIKTWMTENLHRNIKSTIKMTNKYINAVQ